MSNETENPDFFVSAFPQVCDQCGRELIRNVADHPEHNLITHYCEHHGVFANVHCGLHQGKPAILSWELRGPGMSLQRATEIMSLMVDKVEDMGGYSQLLTDPEKLN